MKKFRQFAQLDGSHPLRDAVPDGFVDYPARLREGGRVFFFNFYLAKEMGLIPKNTPHRLEDVLRHTILNTFSLQIINEYDQAHAQPRGARLLPNRYMATRYLQLQHRNKQGKTSGDGRSIWNGHFHGPNGIWDVSSCGTGATCLSPAYATEGKPIKTGDKLVSYGCGQADLSDGLCAAVMSEIFHRGGITTERTLAVISYPDGTSVNVRTSPNLLRPAHLFRYLKLGDHAGLKGVVDCYIDRQIANGRFPVLTGQRRYRHLLKQITRDFATAAATFESEYVFCWMDWDGDNILCDAGIIDYGSIRQFGLFHHEYRYDDVDRYSTNITEQKNKAKYLVQTFAQLVDFLVVGRKRNIRQFRSHATMADFDRIFEQTKDRRLIHKLGYPQKLQSLLLRDRSSQSALRSLRAACSYFERAKSARGLRHIGDGITWDAVFCLRDMLREMPHRLREAGTGFAPDQFLQMLKSNYATASDLRLTRGRRIKIHQFQESYVQLLDRAVTLSGASRRQLLGQLDARSAVINRYDRVTGDAILAIAEEMIAGAGQLSTEQLYQVFTEFVDAQVLDPDYQAGTGRRAPPRRGRRLYEHMLKIVNEYREGI